MDYLKWGLTNSETLSSSADHESDNNSNANSHIICYEILINVFMMHNNVRVKENNIELLAIVNTETKVIQVGYKAWCVFLEIQNDKELLLLSLSYRPICAKNEQLPRGLLGTLAMLKASIKFALELYPQLETIMFTDKSGFSDNATGLDISLATRDLCLYKQTWYQRTLPIISSNLAPIRINDNLLIATYKEKLDNTVTEEYINNVITFCEFNHKDIKINLTEVKQNKNRYKKMTYHTLFNHIYKKEGNYVYTFIIQFIEYFNLRSVEGLLWTMKLKDISFNEIEVHYSQIDSSKCLSGGKKKYTEKIKLSQSIIARKAFFSE